MTTIRSLDQLITSLQDSPPRRLAVAAGHDPESIRAAARAAEERIADVTLFGDRAAIRALCQDFEVDPGVFTIIDEKDPLRAARAAVRLVRVGDADVLMKGMVSTDQYVRLILDKEAGLFKKGGVLTHLSVLEIPAYHREVGKLIFMSDAGIIPQPDLETKIKMLTYAIEAAHGFGIAEPKAAMMAASEKINPKIPAAAEAAIIAKMAERGQIKGAIVDGPVALDAALSARACQIKGMPGPIQGDVDIMIFPYLEVANVFYKTLTVLCETRVAAIVMGATAPCVLTSRSDTEETKFLSIALGCRLAACGRC
ncbi:phosphate butyryltransferase [Myxococcota bacterium]|nr:phosphate butyryltransferase [Myxococcota bacterium]MBU1431342.1 phosphate butyryltransferase [Myxococcota bacterium]MBU1900278.1 phosphate butyryltransferase [Myxococcota bacterium]